MKPISFPEPIAYILFALDFQITFDKTSIVGLIIWMICLLYSSLKSASKISEITVPDIEKQGKFKCFHLSHNHTNHKHTNKIRIAKRIQNTWRVHWSFHIGLNTCTKINYHKYVFLFLFGNSLKQFFC